MDAVKPVYLLLICQGFYLGSEGQYWTFPSTITALIGSCVEIPCTFILGTSRPSRTVWHLYDKSFYSEILNTKDSSSVLEEYRGRTSLVPGQGCTLRIDPVRREDGNRYYYPGIARDKSINAYDQQSKSVYLLVRDAMNVQPYESRIMTEGKAATIQCSANHTCGSSPPTIQWNKPGRVTKKSVENSRGFWTEKSELTYIPSYLDDWRPLQCTVTYPNGQKTESLRMLNIYYAPKNVTVTVIGKDEIIEGSNVTLQCNSVSNPDVYKYEWYKGKEKTRLQYTGREITVRKVTGNMEPYSCAAINTKGRGESALMEIPVLYKGFSIDNIILLATIGANCLLLLVLLVYYCWRKRCQKLTTNETESSPDAVYTDLVKSEIQRDYDKLEPLNTAHMTFTRGNGGAAHEYENVMRTS